MHCKMKKNLFSYILFFSAVSLFWACEEEVENLVEVKGDTVFDTVESVILPNARILEYTVENAPTVIYSSINESARTITVYLPYYYGLGFIDPVITLPEGATISPDDEELVPVFGEDPFVYTVSAPGESDVQYSVLALVQQPELVLEELSTSEDTTVIGFPGGFLPVRGENFIPNVLVTRTFMVDENENALEVPPATSTQENARTNEFQYLTTTLGEEFPEGLYWLEVRVYALTARMKYPVYLKKR